MFFDDLPVGYRFRTGERALSAADITGFARVWDPQSFHLDAEAARRSPYGGLIASGFHTLLTAFTLELAADVWTEASMGSPGMDAIRWLKPVRPGDRLHVEVEVIEQRPSRSKPDRGMTRFAHDVFNQNGETVMTYEAMVILARRPR